MEKITPDFEIDSKGRVICKMHSDYEEFIRPDMDYFEFNFYLDHKLTCKTCHHYAKNDCHFSKEIIDEIEEKREKRKKFKCVLCGKKVERMFTVIHKLYLNEFYNVEIPLVCCNCYDYLNYDDFMRESMNRIYLALEYLCFGVFFLGILLFLIEVFNWQTFIVFIFLIPWTYFTFKRLKKIKSIYTGIIEYKNYFGDKTKS